MRPRVEVQGSSVVWLGCGLARKHEKGTRPKKTVLEIYCNNYFLLFQIFILLSFLYHFNYPSLIFSSVIFSFGFDICNVSNIVFSYNLISSYSNFTILFTVLYLTVSTFLLLLLFLIHSHLLLICFILFIYFLFLLFLNTLSLVSIRVFREPRASGHPANGPEES